MQDIHIGPNGAPNRGPYTKLFVGAKAPALKLEGNNLVKQTCISLFLQISVVPFRSHCQGCFRIPPFLNYELVLSKWDQNDVQVSLLPSLSQNSHEGSEFGIP